MALRSYWKLEDLTDEQTLHDLVNTGGADQVADGYDFEDADSEYMTVTDIGDDYDFGDNVPFTLVAWVKIRPTATIKTILAKYPGAAGYTLRCEADGTIKFTVRAAGQATRILVSDNTYEDNAWHMIAVRRVASSTTIKLWIDNGIENKSGVGWSASLANADKLHIGRYSAIADYYFDGVMGNILGGNPSMGIQIYDTELSDAYLLALYSAGWAGKYIGTTNPAKINGTAKVNVYKADGVLSA